MRRCEQAEAVRRDSERLKAVLDELGGVRPAAPDDSPPLEIVLSLGRKGGGRWGRRPPPAGT